MVKRSPLKQINKWVKVIKECKEITVGCTKCVSKNNGKCKAYWELRYWIAIDNLNKIDKRIKEVLEEK